MATAGRTSTWPTTATPTNCGSTRRTGLSRTKPTYAAARSTRTASPRRGWAWTSLTSTATAPSIPFTGFGTVFFDYDNDGWLDIVAVNGAVHLIEELKTPQDPYPLQQRKQLFHNLNNGSLRVILNRTGSAKLWLGLRLLVGKRDAYGATVEIRRQGAPTLRRRVRADGSYLSANDPRILVGLGDTAQIQSLTVHWPDGRSEAFPVPPLRQYTTLVQSDGLEESKK